MLKSCVTNLTNEEYELRAVALIRLAIVERHSGRLQEALSLLEQVSSLENLTTPWTKGRFRTEMANTLKEFGVAEGQNIYFDRALNHYEEALLQFEQVGNLRYAAAVETTEVTSCLAFSDSKSLKPISSVPAPCLRISGYHRVRSSRGDDCPTLFSLPEL